MWAVRDPRHIAGVSLVSPPAFSVIVCSSLMCSVSKSAFSGTYRSVETTGFVPRRRKKHEEETRGGTGSWRCLSEKRSETGRDRKQKPRRARRGFRALLYTNLKPKTPLPAVWL